MACSVFRNDDGTIRRVEAPNKEESNLYKSIVDLGRNAEDALKLWAQAYTPSFKAWFGDWEKGEGSKVVDENGEPLVVYHGSGNKFDTFKGNKHGLMFFTPNKDYASTYAQMKADNINQVKYYAKEYLKNRERYLYSNHYDSKTGKAKEIPTDIENPILYDSITEYIKDGYTPKQVVSKILDEGVAYDWERKYLRQSEDGIEYSEPDYEWGEAMESGEQGKNAYFKRAKDLERKHNLDTEEVYSLLSKVDPSYHILSELEHGGDYKDALDQSKIEANETIYPVFLNIKNPQKVESPISNEAISDGELKIDKTKDGIIGKDAQFYHRVGSSKVVFDDQKVYVSTKSNQVKSLDNEGSFSKNEDNIFKQKEGLKVHTASPETIKQVKEMLNRMGIEVKSLDLSKYGGNNGVADLFNSVVQIADGKEATTLTEEGMHIATAILKTKNSSLYKEMMSSVGQYKIYRQVLDSYKDDPEYRKEGKPNIIKLKEEAIGKILAEYVMKENGDIIESPELVSKVQSWWDRIVSFINHLIGKTEMNPFKEAANKAINENIGTKEDINSSEVFKQKSESEEKQEKVFNALNTVNGVEINKVVGKDEEGGDTNWYEINGKKVENRVTDIAHRIYDRIFKDKEIKKSEYQQAVDEIKRNFGVKGHLMFETIFNNFFNKDTGLPLQQKGDDSVFFSQLSENEKAVYRELKKNLTDRILAIQQKYGGQTKFLSERMIYSPKRGKGNSGEAGTIDFMFVTPDAKVGILDWKFIDLNTNRYEDVPWYKVTAWRAQIGEYKNMLIADYGLKASDFLETRAIPILTKYRIDPKNPSEGVVDGIKIGNVDTKLEESSYLLPVGLESETTGNKAVDSLITKLNSSYDKLSSRKTISEEEKRNKADLLNGIYKAIRHLQIKQDVFPLIDQAKSTNIEVSEIIAYIRSVIDDKTKLATEKDKSEIADAINDADHDLSLFSDIDVDLNSLYNSKELSPEEITALSEIRNASHDARLKRVELQEINEKFMNEVIASPHGIDNLFTVERIVKGWNKWFGSTSTINMKTIKVLFNLRSGARHSTDFEVSEENAKLAEIRNKYVSWATSKGLTIKNMFDGIVKKADKNELIDEFDEQFSKTLKEKIKENDTEWIEKNVDMPKLREYLNKRLAEEHERIDNRNRNIGTEEQREDEKHKARARAEKEFNLDDPQSYALSVYDNVVQFPLRDIWESKEFRNLNKPENKAAKDFYNYIKERNSYYTSVGYINSKSARSFLPYIQKSLTEKMVFGGKVAIGESFLRSISLDESTSGYGSINPITLEIENKVPKYFTHDVEGMDLSTDLFKNMSLYNEMAIRYKFLSDIEGQAKALLAVERAKANIATNPLGKIETDPNTGQQKLINDDSNYKLLESTTNALIYDNKFDKEDTVLMRFGDGFEKINEALGYKIFPEGLKGRAITVNRLMDANNKFFQMKILGFHGLASLSNFFGGTAQAAINAGRYFTPKNFVGAEARMTISKFNGEDGRKVIGAIKYFLSLTENQNREDLKHLALSKLSQEQLQDWLMIMMRESDMFVQSAISLAMFDNLVVMDGKVVNAREYVRSNDTEYLKKYEVGEADRSRIEKDFENKVAKLISEQGMMKQAKIEGDNFIIPGVDRNSKSVHEIREAIQTMTKDALGNLTEEEMRLINTNILYKSFMVFKNWIPRLVDVRIAELRYNESSQAYEWGRARTYGRALYENFAITAKATLKSLAMMNGFGSEEAVNLFRKIYDKKATEYEEMTGEKLKMTEGEFIDMMRQNIKSDIRDLVIASIMMSSWLFVSKIYPPGDDEDEKIRNYHKFAVRALDKFSDELMFFYDPFSAQQILGGNPLPAMGNITDTFKFLENFMKEMYGIGTGNEKLQESTHTIKYFMKLFPIGSQAVSTLPLFAPEMAKDLGIKINIQSRQ